MPLRRRIGLLIVLAPLILGEMASFGQEPEPAQVAVRPARRSATKPRHWTSFLADPRSAVLFVLVMVIGVGGTRKLLKDRRARGVVDRLNSLDVAVADVEAAANFGREGITDLFRLQQTAKEPAIRRAAGASLAVLWGKDDLIAEEEKALVMRGADVQWKARRRYPRALRTPFPVVVRYGLPFLKEEGPGIRPENLEWSHRILGTERAGLETFSPWKAGAGEAVFEVDPRDFPANGPHRLVLHARARTKGLTSEWTVELPQSPFPFEFDPLLQVDALLTLPDAAREQQLRDAIRLRPSETAEGEEVRYLPLDENLVLRDPPELFVRPPLPSDLAHDLFVEFEGVPGTFRAGRIVVSGQGSGATEAEMSRSHTIGPIEGVPTGTIDGVGDRRMRLILTANPDLGWTDPEVRSIWPGSITTEWTEVRVIRK